MPNIPNIDPAPEVPSIPSGYVLGRLSPGTGRPQLIAVGDLGRQLIASGTVAPSGTSGALSPIADDRILANVNGSSAAPIATAWAAPAAGLTITGAASTITFALANDLAALEGLGSTGIAVRTASDTWAQRTITGTANRITVTDGNGVSGNPTIDISTSYVGQATITTLGTIATGVWQGTKVGLAYGGTNADLSATGGAKHLVKQASVGAALTVGGIDATWVAGTATNDDAAAGYLGEFMSSVVLVGSAISLTTATPADVTSLSLTAGDWDVSGEVWYSQNAATIGTISQAAITTTSATLPTVPAVNTGLSRSSGTEMTGIGPVIPVGPVRISIGSTTTVYLVAQSTFTVNTNAAYGVLRARRVR